MRLGHLINTDEAAMVRDLQWRLSRALAPWAHLIKLLLPRGVKTLRSVIGLETLRHLIVDKTESIFIV
jgi:hypothetical protein